ncbi:acyl-CoA N-acyltransferase [Plectosphaerella plurivora]|uniref:Acyl-CoA N-acyltransferase n=1 Tax=Plectosphaerella plurivora TaxID=936078 RepID=A0A9P9A6X5_9PEZI|nr:acyl-CoA N-acyltransferase [Plectosphaerella plurivora]
MASKTLQFSIAGEQDAEPLQQLIQSAFQAEDSRADWVGDMGLASSFHLSVDEVLPVITNPESEFLIATDPDTNALAGAIAVLKRGQTGRLAMLAVDPKLHRGGFGRQIVSHAQEYCRQTWGVDKLGLNALSNREALLSWYKRNGFQETGERTPFPYDRFPDRELPEGLVFVEMEKDISA